MSSTKSSKASDLVQIDLAKVLDALKLTQKEFIDLCILCGCDYTSTITGVGPVKAYRYILDYGNIERVLK